MNRKLKKGTKVTYGSYANVFFDRYEGENVVLKDKRGNEKIVSMYLFQRYGKEDTEID